MSNTETSCPRWAAIRRSGSALGGSPPSFSATSMGGRPGEEPAPRHGVLASGSLTWLPHPPVHPGLTTCSQLLCSSLGTLLPPPAQATLWGGSDCRVTAGLQGSPCSRLPGVPLDWSSRSVLLRRPRPPLPRSFCSYSAWSLLPVHRGNRPPPTCSTKKFTVNHSLLDGLLVYSWAYKQDRVMGNCFKDDLKEKKLLITVS